LCSPQPFEVALQGCSRQKGKRTAVQFPTQSELVVNSQDRKTIGITIPATMLGRAGEVIE
jgi:hypothetical protein